MNTLQTDPRGSRGNTPPDAYGWEAPAAKIVVTGAAGYIDAAAIARLLEAGHTVVGLDCLRFGGSALLGSYLTGRFTLARGDIRDPGLIAQVLAGADAVDPPSGYRRRPGVRRRTRTGPRGQPRRHRRAA